MSNHISNQKNGGGDMLIYKFIPIKANSIKDDRQHIVWIGKILEKWKLSNTVEERVNSYNYCTACQRIYKRILNVLKK